MGPRCDGQIRKSYGTFVCSYDAVWSVGQLGRAATATACAHHLHQVIKDLQKALSWTEFVITPVSSS
ncbi:hypothetical protein D7319_11215 [Streptomyces radicis]|uniref:Uncharacterized protein n=1 Tax=Streptomyces radicis TaxID=1750517 RepID=A0A3A9WPE7_9ACTN|nr:hypothetical protein D7319_11215 [Streptomyces radicis]